MAGKPEIVPAELSHIDAIMENVRLDDVQELAALGYEVGRAIEISLLLSEMAWTGMIDGVPVCMFGVCPISSSTDGRPWMVGTSLLDDNEKIFLRRCRGQLQRMQESYDMLLNYVDERNVRAVKWLKWLGFNIEPAAPHGLNGEPFHLFWRRNG